MFKKLRITILAYVLLFVAASQYLTLRATNAWDRPLWVDVYLLNGDGTAGTAQYVERLTPDALAGIDEYFAAEAKRFGLELAQPIRIEIAGELDQPPPALPQEGAFLATVWWSLRMRWFTARLHWRDDRPAPDITLFLRYHSTAEAVVLDRSTALRKAMIAIANVYADRRMAGSNAVVIAHELLHVFGASDKYAPGTNQPIFPIGYVEPDRQPLHPQSKAELMAGRIALSASESTIPDALGRTHIGAATAFEIGWLDAMPPATAESH